jgi:hypothetical protein
MPNVSSFKFIQLSLKVAVTIATIAAVVKVNAIAEMKES